MCKNWSLTYSCEHTRTFRLSKCRGVITYPTTKRTSEPKAACCSTPVFEFAVKSPCGECERKTVEGELVPAIAAMSTTRFMDGDSKDLEATHSRYQRDLHMLHKRFPAMQFKKHGRPEKGQRATCLSRTGSSLKQEVMADDLPEEDESARAYYDDWAAPWSPSTFEVSGQNESACESGFVPVGTRSATIEWSWEEQLQTKTVDVQLPDTSSDLDEHQASEDHAADVPTTAVSSPAPNEAEDKRSRLSTERTVCPPHERCRRQSSAAACKTSSETNTAIENDLTEHMRCLSFSSVITVQ